MAGKCIIISNKRTRPATFWWGKFHARPKAFCNHLERVIVMTRHAQSYGYLPSCSHNTLACMIRHWTALSPTYELGNRLLMYWIKDQFVGKTIIFMTCAYLGKKQSIIQNFYAFYNILTWKLFSINKFISI